MRSRTHNALVRLGHQPHTCLCVECVTWRINAPAKPKRDHRPCTCAECVTLRSEMRELFGPWSWNTPPTWDLVPMTWPERLGRVRAAYAAQAMGATWESVFAILRGAGT
jgi:hypothetical protein